jgi:hypothetical protein
MRKQLLKDSSDIGLESSESAAVFPGSRPGAISGTQALANSNAGVQEDVTPPSVCVLQVRQVRRNIGSRLQKKTKRRRVCQCLRRGLCHVPL